MPRVRDVTAVPPFLGVGFTDRLVVGKGMVWWKRESGRIKGLRMNNVPLLYTSELLVSVQTL